MPGDAKSELIYLKVYKSQIPAIEQAIETAALTNAWNRQVPELLPGNDLCRLPGQCLDRRRQPGGPAAIYLAILQVSAQSAAGGLSVGGQPEGFMKKVRCRSPRLRLDATSYRELHRQVLERDGWRCQVCGSMQQPAGTSPQIPQPSGCDEEQNLITLCSE